MVERESKVKLVFEVDKRGITGVNRETGKVRGAFDKLTNSVTSATKATRARFASLRKDIKETKKEAKAFGDELNFQWERGTSKLLDSPLSNRGGGGFGSGESGNIGGRFGQARGAAGQLGVGGSRELGVAQSAFELGQALPELKEGFKELTESMGFGMNKMTLAAGLAGGALLGVGLLFASIIANAKEARQAFEQVTESERERLSLVNESTESLLQLQKELNAEIATSEELGGEAAFIRARESGSSIAAALDRMAEAGPELENLETRLGNVNDELETRNQLEANTISLAQSAGESIRFMQEAETRGIEATEARILAIENETAQIEAQLEVYRSSGDDSEEVTNQIEALNAQLGRLGAESSVATKALTDGTAAQVDSQKDLERSIEEAAKTAEQSALKIEAANTKYADSIKNIGTQASQALSDAKVKAKESSKDLATTLSDDLFEGLIEQAEEQSDILRESRRDDAQELRDSNRELKQIRKDGFKSERDAARDRNFLALAESREDTREQLSESADAAKEQRDERQIALDEEFADLRLQSTRQRGERLRDFGRSNRDLKLNLNREFRNIKTSKQRQLKLAADALSKELKLAADGANKKLTLEQEYWKQSLELIQKALKSVGGAGARTSGRAPTDALAALGLFD